MYGQYTFCFHFTLRNFTKIYHPCIEQCVSYSEVNIEKAHRFKIWWVFSWNGPLDQWTTRCIKLLFPTLDYIPVWLGREWFSYNIFLLLKFSVSWTLHIIWHSVQFTHVHKIWFSNDIIPLITTAITSFGENTHFPILVFTEKHRKEYWLIKVLSIKND